MTVSLYALTDFDGYMAPPERMCNSQFLKELLAGTKKMVRTRDVRHVENAENYSELSISSLLDFAREHKPQLFEFMPNELDQTRISRRYLIDVSYE